MHPDQLHSGITLRGPLFPEPVQAIQVAPLGSAVRLVGKGLTTNQVYDIVLNADQLALLEATSQEEPYDGDARRFRLGVEAMRLALAYEYDPYFSLSIARIDPLPHQLEAVYDYFMRLPRVRFLLADDPGAGKTVMAGLLLKELKIRGLVKRTLIVAPANLTFQWQREMKDKFRENFEVMRGDVLRANYGANPWQEKNQVVTSISWVSHIEDARDSLLRSHWDLIIVDEAHKMSAYSQERKTLYYQLGEALSGMTDHYLLMTATPHKGDPDNFCLFLELLDRDVYGDVKSLRAAMAQNSAPFYLRRTKEALVTFPDPETGEVRPLFTNREVRTISFEINEDEYAFYEALTHYVEEQSIKASSDDSARGRALTFTMAMLQRRFASSICAARRSLQRMRDRRQDILDHPDDHRREQIERRLPDDFEDLTDEEQQAILDRLEGLVASADPAALRLEIAQLNRLIAQAELLEQQEIESKLIKLKNTLIEHGVFADKNQKLLLFTEHKDTLDYLVGKLEAWGLTVTQIHGGMKIGDRDTPGTRLHAEQAFRDDAQVLVATEAAGEGINLQFCWFMINYDIPWNPVRLEQRMGRIHRYGQRRDCLILNFVATNTREGRVLDKLLDRLRQIREDLGDKVFDVVGEVFPANQLEKLMRDMYAQRASESEIKARIVRDVDVTHFRAITESALEGLAKRELNLAAIIGKAAEARERRLVPEVIEDFFLQAAPLANIYPKETRAESHIYRVGRVPRNLWRLGDEVEPRYGRLGREYRQIVFDKDRLSDDVTSEWVTPGHPLFEVVRQEAQSQVQNDLQHGAVFYDLNRDSPARLDVFTAAIRDGRGNTLRERLFVVHTGLDGVMTIRQPTLFLDLLPAPAGQHMPEAANLPDCAAIEGHLIADALQPFLVEVATERRREVETIARHLEISLNAIIDRAQLQFNDLVNQQALGSREQGLEGRIKMLDDKLLELNDRLDRRREELRQEANCTIANIRHLGRAWVLPHPERNQPNLAPMVRDEEIERIAVETSIAYERTRGWLVESVEAENRGFDLISRRPHPGDPATAIGVRFIEVKGRAGVGDVALSANEYRTAQRLGADYWLYVVYGCATEPELRVIQDPAQLDWKPIVMVEHYRISAAEIGKASHG